ncbi:MAG: ATP synthase F1 subunit epsilon [Patescibacteria group bacterium]|nr:ATP synthase F1 subunit epsilon [Patescibacteria group bacterium]MDD4610383.1 ATP synthase F1 subunit epsilon [Patescibacteria group bacterium]
MSYIKFEITTPERIVLKEEIQQVTVPTKEGEITVLPGHIPLVSVLLPGVIEVVKNDGNREVMSVTGGFIEVFKDKVVILADSAERAEEINLEKAEEARQRAEEAKKNVEKIDHVEFANLSAIIAREMAKTKAAQRWKKMKNILDKKE